MVLNASRGILTCAKLLVFCTAFRAVIIVYIFHPLFGLQAQVAHSHPLSGGNISPLLHLTSLILALSTPTEQHS